MKLFISQKSWLDKSFRIVYSGKKTEGKRKIEKNLFDGEYFLPVSPLSSVICS